MSSGSYSDSMERALSEAVREALATAVAGLSPLPTVRRWRDQATAATYPAVLVHCPPATPEQEATPAAELWESLVNVAAVTHCEATPEAAADPDGEHCQLIYDTCRAALLDSFPAVEGVTILETRIAEAQDAGDGAVNMLTVRFSVRFSKP